MNDSTSTLTAPITRLDKLPEMDEKQLLHYLAFEAALSSSDYLLEKKVEVKRLRKRDIRTASQTLIDASEHDPLAVYVRDTPDARRPKLHRKSERLRYAIGCRQWVRRNWGLTVNEGRAVVCALPATESNKKTRRDKRIDGFYRLISRALSLIGDSKLQRKRYNEVSRILDEFSANTLGSAVREMWSVNALATSPDFQRRGYGGALVDAITKMADAESRSTYLLSSNPANTEFYNSHGFFTIAEVFIGVDDPTWHRPPLPIALMVRIFGDQ
ncbi:uncharacterized protein FOMMEDRAFT_169673 [Fomitiporia mediterranea MF3/22]|uniref:uncharacterized protein n=1 Tax=Fomitiporia mediterranea (strain MF3/22) TaxID=694068 RepID=UPI00044082CF|nr:uncharacterized protein FOMMEDRAFT_169673 [Fomitiporia mediterranea MF3/22]EJD01582.1 hypothetical protein FOMMEDRAFT_169673 [Fomitiporia mediterranea MF3/22]